MIQIQTQNVMQIFVAGKPAAQTRARHGENGAIYSNATEGVKRWKAQLGEAMRKAIRELALAPLEGALCVDMTFMLPIKERARWGHLCASKPDKDNLEKAVLDAMGDCKLFAVGDQQVASGDVVKVWCSVPKAGVFIRVARARAKESPHHGGDGEGGGGEGLSWLAS